MAHEKIVIRSIETDDGGRCVDIFRRPDGTYGFEEYRRDIEDNRGWQPIACHAEKTFADADETFAEALKIVPWLCETVQSEQASLGR